MSLVRQNAVLCGNGLNYETMNVKLWTYIEGDRKEECLFCACFNGGGGGGGGGEKHKFSTRITKFWYLALRL